VDKTIISQTKKEKEKCFDIFPI